MIGANSLESFSASPVGTGSNVHCFAGAVLSTFVTSSDVTCTAQAQRNQCSGVAETGATCLLSVVTQVTTGTESTSVIQ